MRTAYDISPSALRDLAASMGWQLYTEAIDDGLFVLNHPEFERRQLAFPVDDSAADYGEALRLTLNKLGELHRRPLAELEMIALSVYEDNIRFRLVNAQNEQQSIPLSYAVSALSGVRELLLSAACTALKPQVHHPRMNRSEALALLDNSKFRHTEKGSFAMNISLPLEAGNESGLYFPEHIPFGRQASVLANEGIKRLLNAIMANKLDGFVDELKGMEKPIVSSNLCKAITQFAEVDRAFDLHLDFRFSQGVEFPEGIHPSSSIKVQRDYFRSIDEVRQELKQTKEQRQEETFMATVERLSGEINVQGEREGEVILNAYKEGESFRIKADLSPEKYEVAYRSHIQTDSYIKLKGKVMPGNQPKTIKNLSTFELINP